MLNVMSDEGTHSNALYGYGVFAIIQKMFQKLPAHDNEFYTLFKLKL